ncbi:MAG: metalloregulator ArsR/SmtB family transcription factor [Bacteroidales bacterium]|nr:metalloregulator ArsR/SmtB family transcription factor [Bacteroidales bacterium]
MVQAKKQLFDSKLQRCSDYCKALSHPARLAILKHLSEVQTCITGDISSEIPLGRTTINQHLAELKSAGLIQGNIAGVRTYYCLKTEALFELKNLIDEFLGQICCNEKPKEMSNP